MGRIILVAAAAAAACLATSAAQAKTALKWMDGPPGLPSGSRFAVTAGDPAKEGPFTIQAKFPANYAVPAHHHPSDERVQVISGTLGYGMSDKLDKSKAKNLTVGHHVVMKSGMNHWVFTRGAGATIAVSGKGPFQIVYVDPKDDPRNK